MTRYASVVRDGDGLERLAKELDTATPRVLKSRSDFEDAALTTTAGAVAAAALARTESRGCHHRSDYPGHRPGVARTAWCPRWLLLMELSADELTEARRVIARALEEDLRYGPDVTTLATVPADATTTASMVSPRARGDRGRRRSRCWCSTRCSGPTATASSTASTTAHGWSPAPRR